jgi:hypothetical protein
MSKSWKLEIAGAISAVAICVSSAANAGVVETWNGNDAFNNTNNSITFSGITANQLTLITGDGTYEAGDTGFPFFIPVSTTFTLSIDLNNTWTTIKTWTTSDTDEQLLSGLSTPFNFSLGTVTGIKLSESPTGSSFDPSFNNFNTFDDDQHVKEQFTFNNVSTTPLPATLPLFAGGLGFVGYLTRRRKRAVVAA